MDYTLKPRLAMHTPAAQAVTTTDPLVLEKGSA
jgi:hypothetical protein